MNEASPSGRRLFVALWPDPVVRAELARLARRLTALHVPAANLHLTLVFLGLTPPAREAGYRAVLDGLTIAPFTLELDCIGCFRGPRVLWLGPATIPPALTALVAELEHCLAACGHVPDPRPFAPHVTLARRFSATPPPYPLPSPIRWPVARIVLAESRSQPSGVRYEPLADWPVGFQAP